MAKTVSLGTQDFAYLRENDCFYVDKTNFIREWWENKDAVTLITRPRRFGKTLNMNMLEYFFSNKHKDRSDLFEGLSIWDNEAYRQLQGTFPVIFLSFASVKFTNYEDTKAFINGLISDLYGRYEFILQSDIFSDRDRNDYNKVTMEMPDIIAAKSLNRLCEWLSRFYGQKAIILIDEYDTPLQEAYVGGFWDEITTYIRSLFNSTFKTNPYLYRAIMTGITRVSKESIFSDLNNLTVVTTTSDKYATAFGFTESEVFEAMDSQGIDASEKERVKFWYDGFTFGNVADIYNPWSVTMFLDSKKYGTHWANTSSNGLVGKLIQEGDRETKVTFETLLRGDCIEAQIDEQIIFNQLSMNRNAIWSLLLASGYLKTEGVIERLDENKVIYRLSITNFEVKCMFEKLVEGWFASTSDFNSFIKAMLCGNTREMNAYMNEIALNTFSYFDAGKRPSDTKHPERFYHGFVLGLMVDKADDYIIKSNRESGYGRYDVVMEPKNENNVAVIMEFKVFDTEDGEQNLADTAQNALAQIDEKKYDTDLLARGIPNDHILKYGFAFEGEKCLIQSN